MKNKILFPALLLACSMLALVACDKEEESDSVVTPVSIPFIVTQNINDSYVYGQGSSSIFSDLPDIVAVAVDSVYGFEGGYGGQTGMDSINILKSDIAGWPDTSSVGASGLTFEKSNKANYKVVVRSTVIIAAPNDNPGPTALEGTYIRPLNGYEIEIQKVFDGVYIIDNPGGAAVAARPYLLYNYLSSTGTDSLSFANQTDNCGGGLQLVAPGAPLSLVSSNYTDQHPPEIIATSPLTLSWRIVEFPSASPSASNNGMALCNWGTGVRTFEKQ